MSTMTLDLIARCPFCASETEVRKHPNDLAVRGCEMGQPGVDVFYVHCDGCGCDGPASNDGEREAIDLWNRRTHLAQPAQAVDVGAIRERVADLRDTASNVERLGTPVLAEHLRYIANKLTRALSGEAGPVGDGPDVALLASMATCLHHGFGLLDATQQQSMLHDMRKLWDEVMGRGYYRPENRDRYLAYLASPTPGKEG